MKLPLLSPMELGSFPSWPQCNNLHEVLPTWEAHLSFSLEFSFDATV